MTQLDQTTFQPGAAGAQAMDRADPLQSFRSAFLLPAGPDGQPAIYLCVNSLGPLPKETPAEITAILEQWSRLGVRGWFTGSRPWMAITEEINGLLAEVVGGHPDEVVAQGTLTNNIHLMLACGFREVGRRERLGQLNSVWRDVCLLERRSKVAGI